ncbi:hypothetical protein HMPREF1705_04666 [Acetomicrobium hydrogeniformans ATCC BAA-1850]|uniref:Uncharacterized protein n=1 Tax=Acetomicrobium hydrogeniformans ATCC BAA-1850 TaxID=592015 RepID=A0A0T5X8A4_9BACT|nr:hypothetical protein HMPREF1705_04666 [Acetomicrobium hydrogeniformans ATCC BAA-1850]
MCYKDSTKRRGPFLFTSENLLQIFYAIFVLLYPQERLDSFLAIVVKSLHVNKIYEWGKGL